jgi:hypothetical protein
MATGMTDAEFEEQMRGCIGRCYVCADLYGFHHHINMWDADEHDAAVALAYLADPDAAEIRLAKSSYEPDPLAKIFGTPALPLADKVAKAKEYAAKSKLPKWREFTANLTPEQIATFESQERRLRDDGWDMDDVIALHQRAAEAAEPTKGNH